MVFSSPLFLFFFFPVLLLTYYSSPHKCRNLILLVASILFYAWGEPLYVFLMIASILFNWIMGLLIHKPSQQHWKTIIVSFTVLTNLAVLVYYKYLFFFIDTINKLLHTHMSIAPITLPIGISFFTFHAISYIVDIYRGQGKALKNPLHMGVYISLFPQLVAGPIIRYHDVAEQLAKRRNTLDQFASGIERFVYGLGKKLLLANPLGQIADQAFSTPVELLSTPIAWFGIICYTLQIYFDFSGYSDMAIGLARLFGFELTENFNYPYIAKSIREFWRRWHLSLSTWFRDYLYIPLGGNRGSKLRERMNLYSVFLLCGLWHGASLNFAFWGLFHGTFLVLERGRLGQFLNSLPNFFSHLYTLLIVMIGWVFFKSESFTYSLIYIKTLFLGGHASGFTPQMEHYLNTHTYFILMIALIASTPLCAFLARDWKSRRFPNHSHEPLPQFIDSLSINELSMVTLSSRSLLFSLILIASIVELAVTTYNPFIYFRF